MSLADGDAQLLAEAAANARRIVRETAPRVRRATVMTTDPISILYDGPDEQPSVVPPQSNVTVAVGDRVQVLTQQGQSTIIGICGGRPIITRHTYVNSEFFTPAAGVAFGAGGLTMTADVGEDGSAQVVWSGELVGAPYIAGSGQSASFGDVTQHLPAAHAAVQMQHTVNAGFGVMTTAGQVTMRWGSFATTGTTTLWMSCTYSIPGGTP